MKKIDIDSVLLLAIVPLIFGLGAASYRLGYLEASKNVTRSVSVRSAKLTGLPVDTPLMLYWIGTDGTVSGTSAQRTEYSGVLPYSTNGSRVPFFQFKDYDLWSPLDPALSMGNKNGKEF